MYYTKTYPENSKTTYLSTYTKVVPYTTYTTKLSTSSSPCPYTSTGYYTKASLPFRRSQSTY